MNSNHRINELARPVALLAVLLLAATPALAGERQVDETLKAQADGVVYVENIAGSITVEAWDRDEVHITGTLGKDVEDLLFKSSGRKTRVKVEYPRKSRSISEGADLVIKVPQGSSVEVECVSADVTVKDVAGSVYASSISGDVIVDADGPELEAETISGDVEVDTKAAEVAVSTISGTLRVNGEKAEVEASVVSGEIALQFDTFLSLDVETVSGDVEVTGDFAEGAKINVEIHSGELLLTVPADVSADFRINTFSGSIDNGFGQKARRTSEHTPGRELEFTTGGGSARVRLNTFSGDVVIRKR